MTQCVVEAVFGTIYLRIFEDSENKGCFSKLNAYSLSYRLTVCRSLREFRHKGNIQLELNSYKE